jgi:hypothetical protein
VQAAEMNAVKAAKQAQQDAKNAAADEMDAAQQVQNALTNSMGPPEQTPNDSNDQEDALDAARDAQQDATDAAVQHADAVQQVQNAQAAFDSAEPTSVTMKALSDAKAAEAAAKMSADKAQADADKANMAANAAQSCGTSTDLPSYLMCLDMMAGDAATDAVQAKAQADILAEAAADDALPEPSPQNDSDNANDVDTVLPQMNAQDIAKAAMSAVQSPPVPHYSAGSQAALFIDQAMVEARAAKSAADFCAAFANDADMDRNAVGDQVMAAHNAAMATHTAVENALVELTQIETFDFFSDPLGFVDLFNRFFMDYNTAVTQEAMAIKADTGPNGAQAKLSRVSSDKTNADTQRSNAETHKNNTNTDIMLAAQAALTAANMNPNHEGDNHSGDRPGGNHVG